VFLKALYNPKEGQKISPSAAFTFKKEQIIDLASECQSIVANQPMVIKGMKPPIKIFGNIHGDYVDLMRFFDIWKGPNESVDIQSFDYVFLGNYVDRGAFSLEVICLLMALKLKYPKQIVLLRGNHEDRAVNRHLGFGKECATRLGEDINDPNSVFARINTLFDYLPLAAIIEDKTIKHSVMCVHAGIGSSISKLEDIERINRPLSISLGDVTNATQQMVIDLLWSDPTATEDAMGIVANTTRDPQKQNNIMMYGPD